MYLHDTDINTTMLMDWVIVIILFSNQLWYRCTAGILLIWYHTYKDELYSKWGIFNLVTNFLCLRPFRSSYYLTSEQFVTCSMHPNSPHFANIIIFLQEEFQFHQADHVILNWGEEFQSKIQVKAAGWIHTFTYTHTLTYAHTHAHTHTSLSLSLLANGT